jgi:hypothetical protein
MAQMLHRTLILALVGVAALTLGAGATEPAAQAADDPANVDEHRAVGDGPHAAAMVVDTGEEVKTVCVRFAEEQITGEELLDRTGLDVVWSYYGTLGAAACSICGVGCPAEDCHCATPFWWSYWQGDGDGGWTTSPIGASTRKVRDGDMDARLWHDGSRRPPEIAFATICQEAVEGDEAVPPGRPETDPQAVEPPAEDGLAAGDVRGLAWFGVTLLAVLGAIAWVRRSRGKTS